MKKEKRMSKGKRKKRSFGRRAIWLLFFLGTACVVYLQGQEIMTGGKAHLLGIEDRFVVRDVGGLSSLKGSYVKVVKVTGIPDYESVVRFPSEGRILTCFRMTGFQNRLFVCTWEGLRTPEEIGELLRPRSMEGRLVPLKSDKHLEPLVRGLQRAHRIRPHKQAFLLMQGESPVPSTGKTVLLMACLILCVFFLYRTIKT